MAKEASECHLLEKDAKKFIENDGSKRYRISTHPDFVIIAGSTEAR